MQTKVQAPAEQSRQHQVVHPSAQLAVDQEAAFEDHRQHAAQLKSTQTGMAASPLQQNLQVLQAKMNVGSLKGDFNKGVVQNKTKITHTSAQVSYKKIDGTVGVKMHALLDPDDAVKGSSPDLSKNVEFYNKIAASTKSKFARGHLLNHDLGGHGTENNLFPITAGANARHSILVEQNVKQRLADLKKFLGDIKANTKGKRQDKANTRLEYSVDVLGDPAKSQFKCSWHIVPGSQAIKKKVKKMGLDGTQNEIIESTLTPDDSYIFGRGGPVLANWRHEEKFNKAAYKKSIKREKVIVNNIKGFKARDLEVRTDDDPGKIADAKGVARSPSEPKPEDELYFQLKEFKRNVEEEARQANEEVSKQGRETGKKARRSLRLDSPSALGKFVNSDGWKNMDLYELSKKNAATPDEFLQELQSWVDVNRDEGADESSASLSSYDDPVVDDEGEAKTNKRKRKQGGA